MFADDDEDEEAGFIPLGLMHLYQPIFISHMQVNMKNQTHPLQEALHMQFLKADHRIDNFLSTNTLLTDPDKVGFLTS